MHKFILSFTLLLAAFTVSAQVAVKVDGGTPQPIGSSGGLYFAGDTLLLVASTGDTSLYPLSTIGVVTFQTISQGIETADDSDLALYPVPTSRYLFLQGIGDTPRQVTIYNASGQTVFQQRATDGTRLDLQHLPAGAYLLRCGSRISKIVKQH